MQQNRPAACAERSFPLHPAPIYNSEGMVDIDDKVFDDDITVTYLR